MASRARRWRPKEAKGAAQGPTQPAAQPADTKKMKKKKKKTKYKKKKEVSVVDKIEESKKLVSKEMKKPTVHRTGTLLAREITKSLENNSYSCAICTENVNRRDSVWSCPRCFVIFHLQCVRDWSLSSMPIFGDVSMKEMHEIESNHKWRCPGCQLWVTAVPEQYRCFCGKTSNPSPMAFLTPHACDNICGKERRFGCPHPCNQPCHPGACPPCEVLKEPVCCPCGKTSYRPRCGEDDSKPRLCKNVCGKMLECFNHKCTRTCHEGKCGPCDEKEPQPCFCGKESKALRPCGSGTFDKKDGKRKFSCGEVCNKVLPCGIHNCTKPCHAGDCPPCPRAPRAHSQTCACEQSISFKTEHRRKKCTDPIWTCEKTCRKRLPCGHICGKKCHDSPCGPCTVKVSRRCRCGMETIAYTCSGEEKDSKSHRKELKCERKCNARLSCGKHRCRERCCPASGLPKKVASLHILHKCTRVCGKDLKCGSHTCVYNCHSGPCPPCGRVLRDGVACACGYTTIPGPIRCGTQAPKCYRPCSRVRPCGHPCPLTCHTDPCPPCVVFVTKSCHGGHREFKKQICHLPPPSCGRRCGRALKCKMHMCSRTCHGGKCSEFKRIKRGNLPFLPLIALTLKEEKEMKGKDWVWSCGNLCEKKMKCGHKCTQPCHPTYECDTKLCKATVSVKCACGRLAKTSICNRSTIRPKCNEDCKKAERNRRLREALQIGKESTTQLPYPADLLEMIGKMSLNLLSFLEKMENTLEEFIMDDTSALVKWLPSMNAPKRWLVNCVAGPMGLEVESSSPSIKTRMGRSVKITKSIMSTRPVMKLSKAVQKFKADPLSVQTTPEDHLVRCHGLRYLTGPDIKVFLKKFESKSSVFMTGEGRAIIAFTKPEIAREAMSVLINKGLKASTVAVPSSISALVGVSSKARRRRKAKRQENWDDEDETMPVNWACNVCTLLNPMTKTACNACGAPPPVRDYGASSVPKRNVEKKDESRQFVHKRNTMNFESKAEPLRTKVYISTSNPWTRLRK